jgi:hypothetical protein
MSAETLLLIFANELMAFVTVIVAFPGLLPPTDVAETLAVCVLFLLISILWPLYLALAPISFGLLWIFGEWKPTDHLQEWPWKYLRRQPHRGMR